MSQNWKLVHDPKPNPYPCMLVSGDVVIAYFTDNAYGKWLMDELRAVAPAEEGNDG